MTNGDRFNIAVANDGAVAAAVVLPDIARDQLGRVGVVELALRSGEFGFSGGFYFFTYEQFTLWRPQWLLPSVPQPRSDIIFTMREGFSPQNPFVELWYDDGL